MKIKKISRKFIVGSGKNSIKINHTAKIRLNNDEQITFLFKKSQHDFVKKNWGFYATPSINGRLKKENFITALVRNKEKKIYIMVVHKSKTKEFKKYCKDHEQKVVYWLHKF